jgi:putative DNA primase/helicase
MSAPVENNGTSLSNEEIEKAVVSSLIRGGRKLIDDLGVSSIDPNFFFHSSSRKIFGAIAALYDEGVPFDLQIVTQQLREHGHLESVGGAAAITSLGVDGNADPEIVRYNLDLLHGLESKRSMARLAKRMQTGDIAIEQAHAEFDKILTHSSEREKSWSYALNESVVTSSELHSLTLTPRKKLLGDWLCEGDLGFIFAFRGVGKTWFALGMAQALSGGGKLGDWQAHESVKVLYVDGEMPPDLIRDRCAGLEDSNTGKLEFLNHEILFERSGKVLNITKPEVQQAITQRCVNTGAKVLILDNLSTLASGMRENEADSRELVNNWLLDLRRRKIAVIIIHHAGRSGEMRGTSKREDNVFWIIALDDAKENSDDKRGARFISRFTKPSRNTQEEIPAYEWHFVTDSATCEVSISHQLAQTMDVFLGLIEDGLSECSEIAEEMKTSKASVSRIAKQAMKSKKIIKVGREYFLAEGAKTDPTA